MKKHTRILKSVGGIIISSILIVLVLVFLFSSYIAKYLIEKYDIKYTGRKISLSYAYVNLFTGYIYLHDLKVKECDSDSLFLQAKGVGAKFNLWKLFHKTCEITSLTLDQPNSIIIESPDGVNYRDIVERFRPKDTIPSSFHVRILNIKINDGILRYRETTIPINYSGIHIYIESPGIGWLMDTLAAKVSLLSGNGGGSISGNIAIDLKSMNYRMNALINKLELKFLEQYFKMMANYGSFRANLDADLKVSGSFRDAENLNAKGSVFINDFHFGETAHKDFASFDRFALHVNAVNPLHNEYLLDSISLKNPYFKFEKYDYLNNAEMMFGEKGNVVASVQNNPERFNLILVIGGYIRTIASNFFKSNYKVNRLAIYNGNFKYVDYSINEKFSMDASPITLTADSIRKNKSRVNFFFKSGIKPYGTSSIYLSINPKDSSDFDLYYSLKNIPITQFNPYLITYTSFPFNRGTLELNGSWNVRNGVIHSNNHLLVIDPRVSSRIKNKSNKWLPMRFIMFFLKDRGNVMDYQIPITGNIKKPNFHYGDVIHNIIKNLFVKPATTPYRIEVKNTENEIENSLTINWGMRQTSLSTEQESFLSKMSALMATDPNISLSVYPITYEQKEKELILLFEAKKKYYLSKYNTRHAPMTKKDSIAIERMSIKDTLFIKYLNKMVGKHLLYTVQDKCIYLLGETYINIKYNQLKKSRMEAFNKYFNNTPIKNRVKFNTPEDEIPYNGYSYFKIAYKGDLPASLKRAYNRMNKLNNEPPRSKFQKERDKFNAYLK
ncbi:MAG TPA: DUF748 domain-containing protein [Bacteroidia bacterium]|nr:DUF748 domain-containing protein [Bacteroidia bacterium]